MEQRQIVEFLNYPDFDLVNLGVRRANLTRHEWEAVQLRALNGLTVEGAAEQLDVSPGTVKNRYRQGMSKLDACLGGTRWVQSILKQ